MGGCKKILRDWRVIDSAHRKGGFARIPKRPHLTGQKEEPDC